MKDYVVELRGLYRRQYFVYTQDDQSRLIEANVNKETWDYTSGDPLSFPAPLGISTLSIEVSTPCILKSRKCLSKSCVEGTGDRGRNKSEFPVSESPLPR